MDLFNDTDEHALNNFIFVNTICPSNMFLQYGIWQLPPSVYDIKIEGGRRWFMCKGSMTCSAKGVMRNPPRSFMDALNGHRNKSLFKSDIQEAFIKNRIVKIPDVYSLNMQFESCLPDNFNHILFQYCANDNIKDKEGMREEGWWDTCTEVKGYVDSTIKGIADDAKSQQLSSDAEGAKEGYKKDELIP